MKKKPSKKPAGPTHNPMTVSLYGIMAHVMESAQPTVLLATIEAPAPGTAIDWACFARGFVVTRVVISGGQPR